MPPKVIAFYKKLVSTINIPETAKEYSFVLLGKLGTIGNQKCYLIDQMIDCSSIETDLSNRVTEVNEQKFNQAIQFAIQNDYNFISIGHPHPNIPKEVKNSEYIREAGLNLSLQDFISYESLYQYFIKNPNIKTAQTVIMYNGEMAMLSKTGKL